MERSAIRGNCIFRAVVPDYASLHPGYKARLPPELALVRGVVRLIDRELVHRRLPQMLGKARRCEIDITLGDAFCQRPVQISYRAVDSEQRTQPLHLPRIAALLQGQLPRHEVQDVDGDAQLEGLVAGDQRRDVVAE